jgi:hypothetical protein
MVKDITYDGLTVKIKSDRPVQKIINLSGDNIAKYSKPEEQFLYDILTNVEKCYSDRYPDLDFYKYKDVVHFEYDKKTGVFWFDYDNIHCILKSKYVINYQEQRKLIKGMVWEVLNLKVDTTGAHNIVIDEMVWEVLNLKVDTTFR